MSERSPGCLRGQWNSAAGCACSRCRRSGVSQEDRADGRRVRSACGEVSGAMVVSHLADRPRAARWMGPALGASFHLRPADAVLQQGSPALSACGSTVY